MGFSYPPNIIEELKWKEEQKLGAKIKENKLTVNFLFKTLDVYFTVHLFSKLNNLNNSLIHSIIKYILT